MLLPTTSLVIAALLPLALAKKKKAASNVVVLAASPDPSNLSPGSMTTAQGCSQFYDVVSGDICQSVANEFNITLDVFYAMNPQVDAACQNPGIWVDSSYCVAQTPIIALAVSSSALVPSAVAKKRKASSNSDVLVLAAAATDPSNLSSGSMTVAQGCTEFYDVVAGDICQSVANEFNITLDVFYAMNPQVDYVCQNPGIWIDSSYCVSQTPIASTSSDALAGTGVVIAITVPSSTSVVAILPSAVPVVAATPTASFTGRSSRDQMIIIHAVLGSLAIVLIFPAAILTARLLRGSNWFPLHAALNVIGASMIVAAFGIGYAQVAARGDAHFADNHTRYGLLIFILILLQVLLGIVSHKIPYYPSAAGRTRFPTLSGKGLIRLLHMALGVTLVVLGYVQITQGFAEYPIKSDGGESVPEVATAFLYVFGGLEALVWIGGWVREGMGGNRPRGTPTSMSPEKSDRDYL